MKRFCYILAAVVFVLVALLSQTAWVKYEKVVSEIPMRDSVKLYTTIYKPRWGSNHPILIQRTPYSSAPYGEEMTNALVTSYRLRNFVRHGYIIVYQDVRGRFMSEGEYENIRPSSADVNEATDAYDTVEWLVNNVEGNNGRAGFWGCSYPGFYAMYAGVDAHPAVKAVAPQAPVTDWFMGDDIHHNGVMMISDAFNLMPMLSHTNHQPTTEWEPTRKHEMEPDRFNFFICATRDSLRSVMHPSSFWDAMSAHPDYDEWWQERDVRRYLYNIKPAVLVVGGTFDAEDCYGAWNTFKAIRSQSPQTDCRLVMGPWAHGAWNGREAHKLGDFDFGKKASGRYYHNNFEFPFFEYHLRDKGLLESLPQVSMFLSGSNDWYTTEDWQLTDTEKVRYYLDGEALTEVEPAADATRSYTSDPNNPVPYDSVTDHRRREYMLADQSFADGREDVLSYTTEPLEADVTFVGEVIASLDVAISTTDADFVVRVIDVFPEDDAQKPNYQMLVRAEPMRARYRESFSNPVPMVPNEKATIRYALPDIAHTFKAGHRIKVAVQSSWFPLAEFSPQQYVDLWSCGSDDFVSADIDVHNSSTITFNAVK
ncbi:MAG: CocE/NonD family hydrolase [Alistipes sp.]|nr:CocE/NonD family hydrolase [Alistipes sp.]MBR0336368.1 CocE/NonD family hydrolase [Alistipes sp.]